VISVLIVDDQDLVREGLRMLLEAEPDLAVAGEASDGSQALAQARLLDPDVILMDVRMPGMNGIEATTRLVQAGARARILMLTTFNLDEYVYHALKAGASGFLLKHASREQLAGGVRAVAAGETLLAPAITRRLIEDFCNGPAPGTSSAFSPSSACGTGCRSPSTPTNTASSGQATAPRQPAGKQDPSASQAGPFSLCSQWRCRPNPLRLA
jgi:DNA-binding NarL/FixJ family response regulator